MNYTYLLIDAGTLAVPLAASFHPRIRFDRAWRAYLPAMALVAAVFIAWDAVFMRAGVWGFNGNHLAGIRLFGLPLEEVLFFVCIPYACVFTHHCFRVLYGNRLRVPSENTVTAALAILLALVGVLAAGKAYTAVTCLALAASLLFLRYVWRVSWLGRFYFSYLVLLVPFFIVNGLLTGTGLAEPVVWYNDAENAGIRLGTIPAEDVLYGMLLVLWNVAAYEHRYARRHPVAA